jgi:competence protein ComEC
VLLDSKKPHHFMLTPAFAVSLLTGMLACLWLPAPPPWWWLGYAAIAGVLLLGCEGVRRWCGVGFLGFAWAGTIALAALDLQLPPTMEHREFALRGTVVELPTHEARRTRFVFEVDDDGSQPRALRGKRLQLAWYDDFDASPGQPNAACCRRALGAHRETARAARAAQSRRRG